MSRPKNSFRTLSQPPKQPNEAQKDQNVPELVKIEIARNFGLFGKQNLIVYISRLKNSFLIPPQLQNSQTQPQRVRNDPLIGQN